jgi:hypothetical protein
MPQAEKDSPVGLMSEKCTEVERMDITRGEPLSTSWAAFVRVNEGRCTVRY